jgi:hypothetical protein
LVESRNEARIIAVETIDSTLLSISIKSVNRRIKQILVAWDIFDETLAQ